MYTFNINNAKLPLAYNKKCNYEMVYYLNNGWISYMHDSSMIDLKIGKKYYAIVDHNCIAFKVKSIAFCNNFNAFIEVLFANGNVSTYLSSSTFFKCIFDSIESYQKYRVDGEKYCYNKKINKIDLFSEYLKNGVMCLCGTCGGQFISVPLYKLDKYNNPIQTICKFKYLWIDEDGLHYSVFEEIDCDKCFLTKEECINSIKIIDFDDERNKDEEKISITLTISIKNKKKKDLYLNISNAGGLIE